MNIPFLNASSLSSDIEEASWEVYQILSQTNEVLRDILEDVNAWYKNLRYGLLKKLEFFVKKWYMSLEQAYTIALEDNSTILSEIGEVSERVRAAWDGSIDEYPLW